MLDIIADGLLKNLKLLYEREIKEEWNRTNSKNNN